MQGDTCDSVMLIEKGRVWLAVTASDGKQAICGLLGAGAFLGDEALIGHAARRHTATALVATEVLVVAKAHMMQLHRTQQRISDLFISHVLTRNSQLSADLIDQILHTSEQRLMRALLALAGGDDRRPRRYVLPDVPQEIIAEMIGTTRSRVNVLMGRFKKRGFIEDDGGVLHVNPSLLVAGGGVSNGTAALPRRG